VFRQRLGHESGVIGKAGLIVIWEEMKIKSDIFFG